MKLFRGEHDKLVNRLNPKALKQSTNYHKEKVTESLEIDKAYQISAWDNVLNWEKEDYHA